MSSIILAYSNQHIGDGVSYNSNFSTVLPSGATGLQLELSCLKLLSKPKINVVTGTLLNSRSFEHITSIKEIWEIVVSANELITTSKKDFIVNFWKSLHKYICVDTTTGDYIQVVSGGGDLPIEYIEENKYLPEVTLKLETA